MRKWPWSFGAVPAGENTQSMSLFGDAGVARRWMFTLILSFPATEY